VNSNGGIAGPARTIDAFKYVAAFTGGDDVKGAAVPVV
jgi:hypothetical protein